MRKLAVFLIAVAGVLAPATGAPAQTSAGAGSQPSIGIRLLEAPVALANDPRARVYIIDHVGPGTTFSRRIGLSTNSATPVQLQLYAGPAVVEGGSFVAQPEGQSNDLTRWITVTPSVIDLPPHGEATATVTIAVPPGATSGERYAVVWAQPPPSSGSGGIAEINRVGIRVYLSVGTGAPPPINFTINSLTAARSQAGVPYVTALVHNTGGRALDLSGTLSLSNGPGGTRAGPFPAKLGTTLGIGQTEPVTIPLDRSTPPGPWTATVSLTSDLVTRQAVGTITFPVAPGASSPPVIAKAVGPRSGTFWATAVIAIVILVAVALLLLLLWRRRRNEEDEPGRTPTAVGVRR